MGCCEIIFLSACVDLICEAHFSAMYYCGRHSVYSGTVSEKNWGFKQFLICLWKLLVHVAGIGNDDDDDDKCIYSGSHGSQS